MRYPLLMLTYKPYYQVLLKQIDKENGLPGLSRQKRRQRQKSVGRWSVTFPRPTNFKGGTYETNNRSVYRIVTDTVSSATLHDENIQMYPALAKTLQQPGRMTARFMENEFDGILSTAKEELRFHSSDSIATKFSTLDVQHCRCASIVPAQYAS